MTNFFSSNYKVIHLPTLSITSANMEPINAKEFDGLIFTSANAVRFLQLKNDEKNIKCFCVGSLTERSLRQKGFTNTIAASGTVNALKNIIKNKIYKKDKSIIEIIYSFIELYFRNNISIKNISLLKSYHYFLGKINNTRTYNLDEETLFMEFEDKILNG